MYIIWKMFAPQDTEETSFLKTSKWEIMDREDKLGKFSVCTLLVLKRLFRKYWKISRNCHAFINICKQPLFVSPNQVISIWTIFLVFLNEHKYNIVWLIDKIYFSSAGWNWRKCEETSRSAAYKYRGLVGDWRQLF